MRLPEPGPSAERARTTWSARDRATLLVLVAGGLIALPLTTHPWYDPAPDAALYVVTARSWLEGLGFTYYGEPMYMRPAGFPAMLAPVLAAGGGFWAMQFLVGAFGVLAAALLFVFQRARVGTACAALLGVSLWLLPAFRQLCNQVMSDVPGVALLLLVLLAERWAARRPSLVAEIAVGVLIGLFAQVRTVVALVVPAVWASRVVEHAAERPALGSWPRFVAARLVPMAAAAFLVQMPFTDAMSPPPDAPPAEQTARFSYATGMWHRDEGDPSSPKIPLGEIVRTRVPARAADIAGTLGSAMRADAVTPGRLVLALVILGGLLHVAWRRRAPADFLALGCLALFSVYFGFKPRLLLPVWIVAFPSTIEAIGDVARGRMGPRVAGAVAMAALLAFTATHASVRDRWTEIRAAHERFAADCAAIEAAVPADARLGTPVAWDWACVMDRPVFSLHFRARRSADVGLALEEMIREYDLDIVFLDTEERRDEPLRAALEARPAVTTLELPGALRAYALR